MIRKLHQDVSVKFAFMSSGIETLSWLFHDDGIVESLDLDPTGLRISSAGGMWVCIWDARRLESSSTLEPLLAALNFYPKFITVAKWDPSGTQLAFAGESGLIGVLRRFSGPGMITFEDGSIPSNENWQQMGCFLGHSSDVMDLNWHSTDRFATASLDNTILVWSVQTQHRLRRLEGHRSFVKALTWDPTGQFLASISDDRSLIIWSVDSGSIVQTITEPFEGNPVSSFSNLKIDWSPDGSKVIGVNVGKTQEAQLIVLVSRTSWKREYRGICGHGIITIAQFNPHRFSKGERRFHYWASGGTAGLVSVWAEEVDEEEGGGSSMNPPETIEVSSAITDLVWSPDGYTLLIVTTTGQIFKWSLPRWILGTKIEQQKSPAPVHDLVQIQTQGDVALRPNRTPEKSTKRRICPEKLQVSEGRVPKEAQHRFWTTERTLKSIRVPVKTRRHDRYSLEVHNWEDDGIKRSIITYQEAEMLIWSLQMDCNVLLAASNNDYLSFISSDLCLQVLDLKSGSFLMQSGPLVDVWCMDCDDKETVIVLSNDGSVSIWNMDSLQPGEPLKLPISNTGDTQDPIQDIRLVSDHEIEIQRASNLQRYSIDSHQLIDHTPQDITSNSTPLTNSKIRRRDPHFTPEEQTEASIPSNVLILERALWESKVRGKTPEIHFGVMKLLYSLLRLYSSRRRWSGRKILLLCKNVKKNSVPHNGAFRRAFLSELWTLMGQDQEKYSSLASDTMCIFDPRV